MRRLLLAGRVLALALAGCGSDSGSEQRRAVDVARAAEAEGRRDDSGRRLQRRTSPATVRRSRRSPTAAVTEFLGLDDASAAVTTMRATSPGEVRNFSEVVTTLEGLLDDSVQRRALHASSSSGTMRGDWRLRAADWAQSCQAGRGHQDYSPEPCV